MRTLFTGYLLGVKKRAWGLWYSGTGGLLTLAFYTKCMIPARDAVPLLGYDKGQRKRLDDCSHAFVHFS